MRKLAIEYVPPASLTPAPYNPRAIDADGLRRLAALLDRHGFVDPIIARREDGLIVGGHQRLKANALRRKPAAEVPVVFLEGISDAQAKALNIALNNERAQGRFEPGGLADLLAELADTEPDLPEATGFSAPELAEWTAATDPQPAGPEVNLPEIFQVVVEVESEQQQRQIYERMTEEGFPCRLLTL